MGTDHDRQNPKPNEEGGEKLLDATIKVEDVKEVLGHVENAIETFEEFLPTPDQHSPDEVDLRHAFDHLAWAEHILGKMVRSRES